MVSSDQNLELCRIPTIEEVKATVFALNAESAGGPDSFTGIFFQECWDIIGEDIHEMLKLFYGGSPLPKSISLSNFINKLISRVVHDRLEKILPSMIPSNQSGFVRGRSIFENILLTQEIVTDIRLREKPANVVIKLDMAKAYDRVSW
uniref:Reverse transcriptase domain-containing protein n=1 Tax=Nicotiana tabacum TaxID=4097 RepID=A0A1S4BG31_TOBAC|nr:PREDICTED: uncharacterized protein LOC107807882 [Nicotiana tabacum]